MKYADLFGMHILQILFVPSLFFTFSRSFLPDLEAPAPIEEMM